MASIPIQQLREFIRLCDPKEPLRENDARYVRLDDEGAARGENERCIDRLRYTIVLSETTGRTCQLFTGYPGTGKTTELYRLKHELEHDSDEPSTVVFIDVLEYLDQYTPLTISDVLRVIAYRMDREATEAEGRDPEKNPGYLERLWQWLQSDLELKAMGFSTYGASLMMELKNNPTFREKAETVLSLRFQEFAREARDVITEAVIRLREAMGRPRVVVIVDGLEKMKPLTPDKRDMMERSIEAVFTSHAEWLALPCHVVYTFPLWLRFLTKDLSVLYDELPLTLPMVKVHHQDGRQHVAGRQKLLELIERRINVEAVFGADWRTALMPLVEASGGHPRDLLRLVRDVLKRSRDFPVPPQPVERAVATLAEEYKMVVLSADLDVVAHVATTHSLPVGREKLRAISWLFEQWQVLTYRNGEEWYDLHPLVRRAEVVQKYITELERRSLPKNVQPASGEPTQASPAKVIQQHLDDADGELP